MRYFEIITERINTSELYQSAKKALDNVLSVEYERPKDRLKAISFALETVASEYTKNWKSGIKNLRGADIDKMYLEVICYFSARPGGSFRVNVLPEGVLIGTLVIKIEPYEEMEEPILSKVFKQEIIDFLADVFEHEMVHYTQTVSIKSNDPIIRSKALRANAYPISDAESEAMNDEILGKYLSSRNEVSAYATNAASQLKSALGDKAAQYLHNLASEQAIAASKAVRKYVKYVKPNYPKVWRSFQRQVASKFDI